MPKEDSVQNILGEDAFFQGKFTINGSLRIDGKYEGETLDVDQLFIGKNGKVKTNITANNVVVEGVIIGNLEARTRVLLLPSARILGDITTPELIIQNGVILQGKCTIATEINDTADSVINSLYNSK